MPLCWFVTKDPHPEVAKHIPKALLEQHEPNYLKYMHCIDDTGKIIAGSCFHFRFSVGHGDLTKCVWVGLWCDEDKVDEVYRKLFQSLIESGKVIGSNYLDFWDSPNEPHCKDLGKFVEFIKRETACNEGTGKVCFDKSYDQGWLLHKLPAY